MEKEHNPAEFEGEELDALRGEYEEAEREADRILQAWGDELGGASRDTKTVREIAEKYRPLLDEAQKKARGSFEKVMQKLREAKETL